MSNPETTPAPEPERAINEAVAALIHHGRLEQGCRLAKDWNISWVTPFRIIADVLSATSELAETSNEPGVSETSRAILSALGKIDPNWIEHAVPKTLPEKLVPRTREELNRLIVSMMTHGGYYHPLELDGINPDEVPKRANVRTTQPGYHEREWDLMLELLRPIFPDGLTGKTILEGGPADGFFTLRCSRAGAHVRALEKNPLMAARTAVFSALAGYEQQVSVTMKPTHAFAPDASRSDEPMIDAVLALGLIYHFNDLIGDLKHLTAFRRPIVFELPSVDSHPETPYDPMAHRDPHPVSLDWLRDWLDGEGFATTVEPNWRAFNASLADGAKIREMVLAVPKS